MVKRVRPPLDVPKIVRQYVYEGASLRSLAAETGYCYGTIRRNLIASGVVMRAPGGDRRDRAPKAA